MAFNESPFCIRSRMSAHSKKKEETIVLTKTDPRAAAYVNLYAVLGS